MADSDSKWLRTLTSQEKMYETGHQRKEYLTHYTLELASAKPIDEEFMRKALIHLYRKVPVLRICFRKRNSELWMKEMDRCEIDLKVIEEGELEEEKAKLTIYTYNSTEGPLWCVRFTPLTTKTSPTSPLMQQGKNFRFYYALIFGIHHGIADGITNVKICNLLCSIMDDLMAGRVIDDREQLGELNGKEKMLSLYDQEMSKLKEDRKLYDEIKREIEEGAKVRPLIRYLCKIPLDVTVMTKSVNVTFDRSVSEKFHKKAKSEGVTLHSAITGVLNLALVKLLQELGIIQDEYNIRAGHDINIRRYYAGDTSRTIGLHIPLSNHKAPFLVTKDMHPIFWETVRKFQEKFHLEVARRRVLTTSAYRIMTEDTSEKFKAMFTREPDSYYSLSNIGNLAGILSEGGDSISVSKLTRFSSLGNGTAFMWIYVHTFRGQLNLSFAYSTKYLTHDFVHRLKELFSIHMLSVCQV